jgi:hypothetical protein
VQIRLISGAGFVVSGVSYFASNRLIGRAIFADQPDYRAAHRDFRCFAPPPRAGALGMIDVEAQGHP